MSLSLSKLLDNPYTAKINSIANTVDLAASVANSFTAYLVSPDSQDSETYLFDTRTEDEVSLESDITDHWVESNSAMQDHIALKPLTITLSGYIGELNNKPPHGMEHLANAAAPMESLGAFAPSLSSSGIAALNRVQSLYSTFQKANETAGRIEDIIRKTPVQEEASSQAKAFIRFKELWQGRRPSTVFTPFGVFENMYIQGIKARQGAEGRSYSEFTITFKQVCMANSIYNRKDRKRIFGRAGHSLAETADKGTKKPPESTLLKATQKLGLAS